MRYADHTFDRVIAEAVTMFVDRSRATRELVRVCKPGGRVLATEFFWRKPPTAEARHLFLGEVCPGMQFDTLDDWVRLYTAAGLIGCPGGDGPIRHDDSARAFSTTKDLPTAPPSWAERCRD